MLVREVAVVVGATASMGPPAIAAMRRRPVGPLGQLVPAQAVEHEQHDLPRVAHRIREPVRQVRGPAGAEQGGDQVRQAGAGVVRDEGAVRHGRSVHHLADVAAKGVVVAVRAGPDGWAVAGDERGPTIGRMRVSTRGDYACRALLSLALHPDAGPTSVRDIAERTGLPQPYLEQILLALKGAGLVRSKRGVGGGYVLARTARRHPPVGHRQRRRRTDHARRLRSAPPGRRLRPRGPVRPARHLGRRRRPHAPPPRRLHPGRRGQPGPRRGALARAHRRPRRGLTPRHSDRPTAAPVTARDLACPAPKRSAPVAPGTISAACFRGRRPFGGQRRRASTAARSGGSGAVKAIG